MMKLTVLFCVALAAYASASSRVITNTMSQNRLPSEYLLSVRPNIMRGQNLKQRMDHFVQKMAVFSHDISVVARYDFTKLSVVHIKAESESLVSRLFSFPEVSSIEANLYEKAIEEECIDQETSSGLWGLARIAKREDSNDNTYSYQEGDGSGGVVYVVDSGIRTTHNDFGGRAEHGYTADWISEEDTDLNGHGTHCAGTVMGATHGVAKYAGAIAVKVLNQYGSGSLSGTIEGLEWTFGDFKERNDAAGGNFPAVVSMSLRFSPSDSMDGVLQELYDIGCITTASAGNQASVACSQSPARAEASIAVMASDASNKLASFSNYGDCADVIGPGVSVLSCGIAHDDSTSTKSGTSMSCPHAAGVLLRHMSQMIAATGSRPSPDDLKAWVTDSSTKDVINLNGRPDTNNYLLYAPCDVTA